jgi:hypothetical protein
VISMLADDRRLAAEAAAAGLAYGSALCWASACLEASFRLNDLARPYWAAVPGLRTDTCGAIAFIVTAVSLTVSKYLRLQRSQYAGAWPEGSPQRNATLAVAETAALLSTGLVAYLSLNAVIHPATLLIQATHFATWPTEGTLRVIALLLCVISVGVVRYLRVAARAQGSKTSLVSHDANTHAYKSPPV